MGVHVTICYQVVKIGPEDRSGKRMLESVLQSASLPKMIPIDS
jgi:hypothetical protein